MPTYSYECRDCGHTYDAFQSMSVEPDTLCPECKGRVERLIGGGAGILFKGTGFYVTDYKKPSAAASSPPSSSSSASPSAAVAPASTSTAASSCTPSPSTTSPSSSSGESK